MDCGLPGPSVHGIHQARILEWVTISSSRGSSRPRDATQVSCIGRFFTTEPPGKHDKKIKSPYNPPPTDKQDLIYKAVNPEPGR